MHGLFIFRFDLDHLFRFTLTVRKNYRQVPYHNWAHAFSVAHAMYTVIKTSQHKFSPLEVSLKLTNPVNLLIEKNAVKLLYIIEKRHDFLRIS